MSTNAIPRNSENLILNERDGPCIKIFGALYIGTQLCKELITKGIPAIAKESLSAFKDFSKEGKKTLSKLSNKAVSPTRLVKDFACNLGKESFVALNDSTRMLEQKSCIKKKALQKASLFLNPMLEMAKEEGKTLKAGLTSSVKCHRLLNQPFITTASKEVIQESVEELSNISASFFKAGYNLFIKEITNKKIEKLPREFLLSILEESENEILSAIKGSIHLLNPSISTQKFIKECFLTAYGLSKEEVVTFNSMVIKISKEFISFSQTMRQISYDSINLLEFPEAQISLIKDVVRVVDNNLSLTFDTKAACTFIIHSTCNIMLEEMKFSHSVLLIGQDFLTSSLENFNEMTALSYSSFQSFFNEVIIFGINDCHEVKKLIVVVKTSLVASKLFKIIYSSFLKEIKNNSNEFISFIPHQWAIFKNRRFNIIDLFSDPILALCKNQIDHSLAGIQQLLNQIIHPIHLAIRINQLFELKRNVKEIIKLELESALNAIHESNIKILKILSLTKEFNTLIKNEIKDIYKNQSSYLFKAIDQIFIQIDVCCISIKKLEELLEIKKHGKEIFKSEIESSFNVIKEINLQILELIDFIKRINLLVKDDIQELLKNERDYFYSMSKKFHFYLVKNLLIVKRLYNLFDLKLLINEIGKTEVNSFISAFQTINKKMTDQFDGMLRIQQVIETKKFSKEILLTAIPAIKAPFLLNREFNNDFKFLITSLSQINKTVLKEISMIPKSIFNQVHRDLKTPSLIAYQGNILLTEFFDKFAMNIFYYLCSFEKEIIAISNSVQNRFLDSYSLISQISIHLALELTKSIYTGLNEIPKVFIKALNIMGQQLFIDFVSITIMEVFLYFKELNINISKSTKFNHNSFEISSILAQSKELSIESFDEIISYTSVIKRELKKGLKHFEEDFPSTWEHFIKWPIEMWVEIKKENFAARKLRIQSYLSEQKERIEQYVDDKKLSMNLYLERVRIRWGDVSSRYSRDT